MVRVDAVDDMSEQAGDKVWMEQALACARRAEQQGEVPVGCVLVKGGQLLASGYNKPIGSVDPSAHAEIVALRQGAQVLQNYRLSGVSLYVTLEPCAMCLGAMLHARIERLVYGAKDPRAGAVCSVFQLADEPRLNHRMPYHGGVLAQPCSQLLVDFFRQRR